jgi:CheY-like chemotaxis protein
MTRTILVVDDEPDICFALDLYLRRQGYETLTANDGARALEQIAMKGIPDAILLDIFMPEIDGHSFQQEFQRVYGPAAPIIVLTAAVDPEQHARALGAVGWLPKPFELRDLDALLGPDGPAWASAP